MSEQSDSEQSERAEIHSPLRRRFRHVRAKISDALRRRGSAPLRSAETTTLPTSGEREDPLTSKVGIFAETLLTEFHDLSETSGGGLPFTATIPDAHNGAFQATFRTTEAENGLEEIAIGLNNRRGEISLQKEGNHWRLAANNPERPTTIVDLTTDPAITTDTKITRGDMHAFKGFAGPLTEERLDSLQSLMNEFVGAARDGRPLSLSPKTEELFLSFTELADRQLSEDIQKDLNGFAQRIEASPETERVPSLDVFHKAVFLRGGLQFTFTTEKYYEADGAPRTVAGVLPNEDTERISLHVAKTDSETPERVFDLTMSRTYSGAAVSLFDPTKDPQDMQLLIEQPFDGITKEPRSGVPIVVGKLTNERYLDTVLPCINKLLAAVSNEENVGEKVDFDAEMAALLEHKSFALPPSVDTLYNKLKSNGEQSY